jgi:hypothetical protein
MNMNKDSPEVVNFMRLFGKLKDWSEDDPGSLPYLADTDEAIKDLCLELLRAAGSLQKDERRDPDFFTAPVDSKFISAWREFEEHFADALLIVRSNAVEAGETHFLSFDWYERTQWEDADYKASETAAAIEAIIDFADSQADAMIGASNTERLDWTPVNIAALPKEAKAKYTELRGSLVALQASRNEVIKSILGELKTCDDEARKSELKDQLIQIKSEFDDDPMPIEDAIKLAMADWKSLKNETGLDLRGVFRRRALVPFVLFPRHVAAHHGRNDLLSIYQNLRQAHEAFVFGAPFAALALMRSIMEVVLRDHYDSSADDHDLALYERINNSRKLLPHGANAAALHRLRKVANAVLHLGPEKNEALPRLESIQLEKEILSLFRVLRALIEGAPLKTSTGPRP